MFKLLVLKESSITVSIVCIVLAKPVRTLDLYSNKIRNLRTDQPNFIAIHIKSIFTYFINSDFFLFLFLF